MSEPVLRDTTRAPAGQWCWCPDIPAGQDPHHCGTRSHRAICRGDGGHVHKDDSDE